jgi:hypothetical protein
MIAVMGNATYSDLAEFGILLVTPDQVGFDLLVGDIESRPQPFGSWPVEDLTHSAVLLNYSGKAISALSYVWKYTGSTGEQRKSRYSNFGSSMQLEALTGRSGVIQDIGTFVLAGSKRLITERGMFGNNLDVLPDNRPPGGGYMGAGGGGSRLRQEEIAAIELVLDLAVLEDGRCVGPDESGLFESLVEDLEEIRRAAAQAATVLRDGGSTGRIFEMLRPLARHAGGSPQRASGRRSPFLGMFANMAIHQLINGDDAAVATWFGAQAQPASLRLYRPF